MFTDAQIKALEAPLDRAHVKSRTQAGRSLNYVEGWHAIAEANRIFGFGEWDRETVEIRQLGEPREVDSKFRVAYMARVRIRVRPVSVAVVGSGAGYVTRDGVGYGSGIDRDLGSAHESALKEAETDAMKRALMTFGNPFGLALYDKEQRNVQDCAEPAPTAPPVAAAAPKLSVEQSRALYENMVTAMQKIGDAAELQAWAKSNAERINDLNDGDFHLFREAFGMHRRELVEAAKDRVPA